MSPGGSATANLALWDSNNQEFIDTLAVETIYDFHDKANGGIGAAYGQNYGLIGEVVKCRHNKDTNQYEVIGSQGLHRFGKTNGAVVAGSLVTVEVYHSPTAASCAGSDSGETVSACAKVDIADNTGVEIVYHAEFKNWFVLSPQVNNASTAHILRATLSSNMCSTDATGSIGSVEFLSGWLGATPTTAVNGLKLAGTTNDVLYAVYRPTTAKWEIINVQHVQNEYLENETEPAASSTETAWPIGAEIVSFYCSAAYVAEPPFFQHVPPQWGIRGALTLAFPRQTAERMVESKLLRGYARQSAVDGIIGKWARRQGVDVFFCYPSLADHVGDTSTIHPNAPNAGTRRSNTFVGEGYDAIDLLAVSR